MTAPTHAAFGVLCAALFGTGYGNTIACALGALLPDIDHPQSSIGRVLFFLSMPINSKFGHRGFIHSFILYLPFVFVGAFYSKLIMWIAIGAISHIIIDSYNVSGVRALTPFTQKTVVCFKDEWRILAGSVHEIFLFIVIFVFIAASGYAQTIGGARKLINLVIRSPKITTEEFTRAGLKYCHVTGQFRWNSGEKEEVKWLVVGTEGSSLVYWDGERLIHKEQGKFLRSKLLETEQDWPIVKCKGIVFVDKPSFWLSGDKWHYAKAGQKAMGTIKSKDGAWPEIKTSYGGFDGFGSNKGLFIIRDQDQASRESNN